ncbi:hypothetical protein SLEP1_g42687 [Rubroshorea leprosula]|uniref:Uncharacterized protein n=1 Tax=Rubroshorea leprosula TaxID=152421 RepID=A0AAV5LAQ8_9ROSI|nr:hypothetical protein SLEP1_g42687 [Rubroshorea leprosula]
MMFSNVILNRRGDLQISCSRRADLPVFLVQGLNCHNIAGTGAELHLLPLLIDANYCTAQTSRKLHLF